MRRDEPLFVTIPRWLHTQLFRKRWDSDSRLHDFAYNATWEAICWFQSKWPWCDHRLINGNPGDGRYCQWCSRNERDL